MRLVYLFMHKGSAPNTNWNQNIHVKGYGTLARDFMDEGPTYLFQRMSEEKIIDEIIIFMEVGGETGHLVINDRMKMYMVPDINYIETFLEPNDIIFCRGGFRGWWLVLDKMSQKGFWTLLYAANTGRQRWKFWDIVFDDLGGHPHHMGSHNRFVYNWKKPTNPKVFFPIKTDRQYDLCIGASYIHDRKGQWRVIDALIELGISPKCVLPGAPRKGVQSNQIANKIREHNLDVIVTGMLPRQELNKVLNESKVFIHAGASGQNDRGPLEAMRCGCPLIITSPHYHSPYVVQAPNSIVPLDTERSRLSKIIRGWIERHSEESRLEVSNYHEETHGIENVLLPEMDRLFSVLRKNPQSNIQALVDEYA